MQKSRNSIEHYINVNALHSSGTALMLGRCHSLKRKAQHTSSTFGFLQAHEATQKSQKSYFIPPLSYCRKIPKRKSLLIQKDFLYLTLIVKLIQTSGILRMKNNKTTGEVLREKREGKGLLLRHVSAKLDIDTALLSKIERNERKATKEQILKLAEILDLDRDNLLIQYLSEKILYEIKDEELGQKALKVAEQKLKYLSKNKSGN